MTDRRPLLCVVCGFQPESTNLGDDEPYGATMFTSSGHYGSTVFDPPVSLSRSRISRIWINVCDKCLVILKDRVWYTEHVRQSDLEQVSKPWEPETDGE